MQTLRNHLSVPGRDITTAQLELGKHHQVAPLFDHLVGAGEQHRPELATSYLPSFQISVASFQSFPTFSHTTTYLPLTSCGVAPLLLRVKVPISRAADGPSDLTSIVVTFGSLTCSAMFFHIASIAALPFTMAEPGGNAVASSV